MPAANAISEPSSGAATLVPGVAVEGALRQPWIFPSQGRIQEGESGVRKPKGNRFFQWQFPRIQRISEFLFDEKRRKAFIRPMSA
jgi:hypothetical protein